VERENNIRKTIFFDRLLFLMEVLIVFIGIYLFMLVPAFLSLILDQNSVLFPPLVFSLRAIMIFLAVPIFLLLSNIVMESQRKQLIVEEDINPFKGHMKLYSIKKKNYKYQILYGLLIFFIVFVPLDFFTYLLNPEMLDFYAEILPSSSTGSHFNQNYFIFLISVIIIQVSVAFYEETLSRGFLTKRGAENFNKISAVIIASLYFGLMHWAYIFEPISAKYPWYFPIIFLLQAFFIGMILSLLIVRKKWIFPLILAHALNNIISSHAIWYHIRGWQFGSITLVLYLPLLIIGLILLLWKFSIVKEGLIQGWKDLKEYGKIDKQRVESTAVLFLIIVADLLMGFIIFVLGLFVFRI